MLLNTKELIGVPVVTRTQQRVGKVASFDINLYTGRIAIMRVKATGIVARLSETDLLVPWDAILEMTREHVTIADGVIKDSAPTLAAAINPQPSTTTFMKT